MAIEQEYIDKIEEIQQHDDKLTDWEKGFIFGNDDSSPISTRPSLSISQKSIIDRIYDQRVKGETKRVITEIKFDSDRIIARKTETNTFQIGIDGIDVGPAVSQRESIAIVGWMSEVIDELIVPSTPDEKIDEPF